MNRKTLLLITVLAEGGLLALGLLLIRFSRIELASRIDISWSATGFALLLCLPMLAFLFFFDHSNWEPVVGFRREINEKVAPLFVKGKLPDLALIALLAGVGEELFFRGWLQAVLTGAFQAWSGILIASLIFGLLHYLSLTYAVYAFLTGLYLGLVYQATGNLYIVMLVHGLYDFLALVYLVSQRNEEEPDALRREHED